jgi:hypothetical protein
VEHNSPEPGLVRTIFQILAAALTFLLGGWTLLNTGHIYTGLGLMGAATLYLAYELFTSPSLARIVPRMFRFVAAVFVLCAVAGLTIPRVREMRGPKSSLQNQTQPTPSTAELAKEVAKLPTKTTPPTPPPVHIHHVQVGDDLKISDKLTAKIQFAFWPVDARKETLVSEMSAPLTDGIVTTQVTGKNTSPTQADNGQIWIQLCDGCRFAEEPSDSTAPPDDPTVRRKQFVALHAGTYFEPTTLKIIPPSGVSSFTIALKYACQECPPVDNAHPQKLRVNLEAK